MARTRWGALLGLLVLGVLAGCNTLETMDWSFPSCPCCVGGADSCREHVVAGSLESVTSSTQTALDQLGTNVYVEGEDTDVRVSCITERGQRLTVVLNRQNTDQGAQTRLRFEWEDSPDESLETQILNRIEVRARN
jgi:hypothetical protein